jgi:hypothetical protein
VLAEFVRLRAKEKARRFEAGGPWFFWLRQVWQKGIGTLSLFLRKIVLILKGVTNYFRKRGLTSFPQAPPVRPTGLLIRRLEGAAERRHILAVEVSQPSLNKARSMEFIRRL